mmetsp:Transcript_1155/g.3671  ORF Transcript_1155/g.3671 Transcript_1155/m.3671 type:complete len:225 (-) Transcript_1155:782-1456(-)
MRIYDESSRTPPTRRSRWRWKNTTATRSSPRMRYESSSTPNARDERRRRRRRREVRGRADGNDVDGGDATGARARARATTTAPTTTALEAVVDGTRSTESPRIGGNTRNTKSRRAVRGRGARLEATRGRNQRGERLATTKPNVVESSPRRVRRKPRRNNTPSWRVCARRVAARREMVCASKSSCVPSFKSRTGKAMFTKSNGLKICSPRTTRSIARRKITMDLG